VICLNIYNQENLKYRKCFDRKLYIP